MASGSTIPTDPQTERKTGSAMLQEAILHALSRPPAPLPSPDNASPATANPAVARCCLAYATALQASKDRYESVRNAKRAYREAIPPLTGQENIRDFIACIAHGMLIEAIETTDGTKFLYAAQVAYGSRDTRVRPSRSKSQPDSQPDSQYDSQFVQQTVPKPL
jgi:hypothetical protein